MLILLPIGFFLSAIYAVCKYRDKAAVLRALSYVVAALIMYGGLIYTIHQTNVDSLNRTEKLYSDIKSGSCSIEDIAEFNRRAVNRGLSIQREVSNLCCYVPSMFASYCFPEGKDYPLYEVNSTGILTELLK